MRETSPGHYIEDSHRMLVGWSPEEQERQRLFQETELAKTQRVLQQGAGIQVLHGQTDVRQTLSILNGLLGTEDHPVCYIPVNFNYSIHNFAPRPEDLVYTMMQAHVVFVDNPLLSLEERRNINVEKFMYGWFWKHVANSIKPPYPRPFAVSKHDFCLPENQDDDTEESYRRAVLSSLLYGPPLRSLRYGESIPRTLPAHVEKALTSISLKKITDARVFPESEWNTLETRYKGL